MTRTPTMPTSEKRRIANARNAQKSTGPKTAEGKAVSRANSLKHGMTGAGVVLPRALRHLADHELAALRGELRPVGQVQVRLVEAAAIASARMKSASAQIE